MSQSAGASSLQASGGGLYKSRKRRERISGVTSLILVLILAVIVIFPIWWIFRSSLMTNSEIYAWPPALLPKDWLFSNYVGTMEYFPFWLYFKNTMTIIAPSVFFGTCTATICGYAFARLRFPGKKFLFSLCVGSMLLPTMVTLIPLYIMWTRGFGLSDSYLPLILPFLCGGGAFNIFLIRQFVSTIPRELDDAAFIDGAGHLRILWHIIIPAIKPAMIVVALLLFIMLWNDLLQQIVYINSSEKFTIAIGLTQFKGSLGSDWVKIMCATCMSFLPGIVFYLIGQKQFVEGIVLTGMKN
jgi:multiple sugar transport system permease protein